LKWIARIVVLPLFTILLPCAAISMCFEEAIAYWTDKIERFYHRLG